MQTRFIDRKYRTQNKTAEFRRSGDMLDITVSVYDHDRDAIPSRLLDGCSCTAADAIAAVNQAHALRELSSRRGGSSGHKAWITVRTSDVSLVLYFMATNIDFDLVSKDIPYCDGQLPYGCVPNLLTMLDRGIDPIAYLKQNAETIDFSPRNQESE
jgi:hypothetical protein